MPMIRAIVLVGLSVPNRELSAGSFSYKESSLVSLRLLYADPSLSQCWVYVAYRKSASPARSSSLASAFARSLPSERKACRA